MKIRAIIDVLKDHWDTPVVRAFVREIEHAIERRDGGVTDFGGQLVKLLRDERALVREGRLAKVASLRGRLEKFTRMVGYENREVPMPNELAADGGARKKGRSKTARLARAALRVGGLKKSMLTAEQWQEVKDAVRRDRAAAKVAKRLGAPASAGAVSTAGTDGRAVDATLLKSVGVEQSAVEAVKRALASPRSGDGWR